MTEKSLRLAGVILMGLLVAFSVADAQDTGDPDFNGKVRSLTDKVRSYELRVRSLNDLAIQYPQEVVPILLSILKDARDTEPLRQVAAQRIREINPLQADKLFQDILDDRSLDPFARRIAMAELVALSEPRLEPKIRSVLDDPVEDPAIRQYALGIYAGWQEPGRIQKLRSYVTSKGETLAMKTNALFLLESLQDFEFVTSSGRRFLGDRNENEDLRKNCVVLAERLKDSAAVPILMRIGIDQHESLPLRRTALSALGRVGTEVILDDLLKALDHEFDVEMHRMIQNTIAAIKTRAAE